MGMFSLKRGHDTNVPSHHDAEQPILREASPKSSFSVHPRSYLFVHEVRLIRHILGTLSHIVRIYSSGIYPVDVGWIIPWFCGGLSCRKTYSHNLPELTCQKNIVKLRFPP